MAKEEVWSSARSEDGRLKVTAAVEPITESVPVELSSSVTDSLSELRRLGELELLKSDLFNERECRGRLR
jgi:hypothetical protein